METSLRRHPPLLATYLPFPFRPPLRCHLPQTPQRYCNIYRVQRRGFLETRSPDNRIHFGCSGDTGYSRCEFGLDADRGHGTRVSDGTSFFSCSCSCSSIWD